MKAINDLAKFNKKLQWRIFLKKKSLLQALGPKASDSKKVVFIVGCQRSGTTMMQRIFERDQQAKVYGEFSELSALDTNKIRLNPLDTVKKAIEDDKPPLIVLKPIVESQNIHQLLDYFPGSRALWLYRHYKDVAKSNLKNFGKKNGINDLRPIVQNIENNWRSEKVSKHTREIVAEFFSETMSEPDAAALFWYVRNSLFFDLKLEDEERVMMCRYNNLVASPTAFMEKIYGFISLPFPGEKIITEVSTTSVGKGSNIQLNPEIEKLCEEMLQQLDQAYKRQEDKIIL